MNVQRDDVRNADSARAMRVTLEQRHPN